MGSSDCYSSAVPQNILQHTFSHLFPRDLIAGDGYGPCGLTSLQFLKHTTHYSTRDSTTRRDHFLKLGTLKFVNHPPKIISMQVSQFIDVIEAFDVTIISAFAAVLFWRYKNGLERQQKLRDDLREDRVKVYNDILKPYITALTPEIVWKGNRRNKGKSSIESAIKALTKPEYLMTAMNLALVGSDEVVRAHNNLKQHFFKLGKLPEDGVEHNMEEHSTKTLLLLGDLLVGIRRSMGNESTKLDGLDMLEWLITDIADYR